MTLPPLTPQRSVVVIGAAFGDVMLSVKALPRSGDDISALPLGQQIGGCAFNVARALQRLGIPLVNAIPAGNGPWGEQVAAAMARENLPVLLHHPARDNGWCLALVDAEKERTFITIDGCEQDWTPELLAQIPVPDNALIYISGYELAGSGSAPLRDWLLAQSADKTLFADFGPRLRDIDSGFLAQLLRKKPLLTLNRDELALLCPADSAAVPQVSDAQHDAQRDAQQFAQRFAQQHDLALIARFDKAGATVCQPDCAPAAIPAFAVTVADTIAAGDSHCAGVLAGLACGLPLTDAVRVGNAVAAVVVSRPGADGAPDRAELTAFLDGRR